MERMGKIVYFKSAFCWIKSKLSDCETRWQGVELLRTILIACISSSQTLFDGTPGSVCNCRKYGKSCLKLKWNKTKVCFPLWSWYYSLRRKWKIRTEQKTTNSNINRFMCIYYGSESCFLKFVLQETIPRIGKIKFHFRKKKTYAENYYWK